MLSIFDFVRLVCAIAMAVYLGGIGHAGWLRLGSYWDPTLGKIMGFVGVFVLGITGFFMGAALGNVPFALTSYLLAKSISNKTTETLLEDLNFPYRALNLTLLELKRRGEDIYQHLEVVLTLLESDKASDRGFGWAALSSAFPELAAQIEKVPRRKAIECKSIVKFLRTISANQSEPSSPPQA